MGQTYLCTGRKNTHLYQFFGAEIPPFFRGHAPHSVPFFAKILQPQKDGILRILYQVGRPVVKYLYATHFYRSLLHVNPTVRKQCRFPLFTGILFPIRYLFYGCLIH